MNDPLHPTGKCRCAGEGKCEWCTTPTICGCTNATCGGCGDGDDPEVCPACNGVGGTCEECCNGFVSPRHADFAAAQLEVALTFAAPAVAVLDRAEDALARLRYPLYCVDRGEMFNDAQFVGPYTSHDEAQQHAGPDDLIARCRRLRPSEIAYTYDAAECWPNPQATADALNVAVVRDGEIPEAAWYAWHDRVVHVEIDDDTYPAEANFKQWVDEHLRADVYICEGDE